MVEGALQIVDQHGSLQTMGLGKGPGLGQLLLQTAVVDHVLPRVGLPGVEEDEVDSPGGILLGQGL